MTADDARGVLRVFPDRALLARGAADAFVLCAGEAIRQRGRFTVALSGGHTPIDLFRLLASAPYRDRVEWTNTHIFWSDERAVPPDDARSNFATANVNLLQPLGLSGAATVHRIEGERTDLNRVAADYAGAIASCLGAVPDGAPPRFDLILLGLGEDGHVASLFPGTPAIAITDRWIATNESPDGLPRITMTFPLINRARDVFLLVAGSSKVTALARAMSGPVDAAQAPSTGIHLEDGRPVWFVDRAAAGSL